MFRFAIGVVVGATVGRPIISAVGHKVLPVVIEKTLIGVSKVAIFVADRLDAYSREIK